MQYATSSWSFNAANLSSGAKINPTPWSKSKPSHLRFKVGFHMHLAEFGRIFNENWFGKVHSYLPA